MTRFLWLLILGAMTAAAQVAPTASLTGTVTDPSVAAVPNAPVTLTNLDTGFERATRSRSDGSYLFTQVPVGLYRVEASSEGFARYRQSGIRLTVNTTTTLDIRLAIGALGEAVTVTADAGMVNTQSGALSQVVQQRYIQELPLNGRNAATLIRMVPGVVGLGGGGAGYAQNSDNISASVNGARTNEVNYRLDGATHMDNVTNTNAAYPNPDALQEFNVQTSNYSAQYGNFAGAVVNVVTRSGSNRLHGSVFEYLRNGAINARNFFGSQPDSLKRNQFGAAIGGPVIRNKLFWFGSYQGTTIRNTSFTNTATVPSAALRRGDFNETGRNVTDPNNNNLPFSNRMIPAARILPIATNLLAKVPTTTAPNGLLRYARPDNNDNHQFLGKADYNFGRHQVSGSIFSTRYTDAGWDGAGTLLTVQIGQRQTTRNFKIQDVYTIRPNLINTVVASGLMLDSTNLRTSKVWLSQFGPVSYTEPLESDRELELGVSGYAGWGSVANSPPGQWIRRNVEVNDTVNWTTGRHSLSAGAEFSPYIVFDSYTKFQQSGNTTFSGQITGNGIADLLLGKAATFVQSAGKFKQTRGKEISFFAEDTIRARPGLTLTLGLRWDPYLPYHDRLGQVAGYRAGSRSERFLNAPPGAVFAGDPGFPASGMNADWNNISPRFGFAWTPRSGSHSTVVRGGYGVFFVRPFPRLYNNFVESFPFSPTINLPGVDFQNPYGSSGVRNPFPPFAPVDLHPNVPFSFPMPYAYFQEDWGVGYTQGWNLTVEQQMAADWLLRLAYVGNKGTHLQTFRERNWALYSPTATVANTNARRPLAPYYASVKEMADAGNSVYHALQATLDKRFSRNFSVLAFYTFSKSIDDESANNQFTISSPHPTDTRFNRGLSNFDVPHNFRVSAVVDVPTMVGASTPLRLLFGGWSISNILDLRSGAPFGLASGRDNSFSGIGQDRADITGNPALPSNRPMDALLARYFDTSLVTFNTPGTFGNSPRNFLRGMGTFNIDAAVQKNFSLTERYRVMLRGEFFNLFNHTNFNQPGASVNATNTFGIINGAASPRILQIGARVSF